MRVGGSEAHVVSSPHARRRERAARRRIPTRVSTRGQAHVVNSPRARGRERGAHRQVSRSAWTGACWTWSVVHAGVAAAQSRMAACPETRGPLPPAREPRSTHPSLPDDAPLGTWPRIPRAWPSTPRVLPTRPLERVRHTPRVLPTPPWSALTRLWGAAHTAVVSAKRVSSAADASVVADHAALVFGHRRMALGQTSPLRRQGRSAMHSRAPRALSPAADRLRQCRAARCRGIGAKSIDRRYSTRSWRSAAVSMRVSPCCPAAAFTKSSSVCMVPS
jgi:hypothetical protein